MGSKYLYARKTYKVSKYYLIFTERPKYLTFKRYSSKFISVTYDSIILSNRNISTVTAVTTMTSSACAATTIVAAAAAANDLWYHNCLLLTDYQTCLN